MPVRSVPWLRLALFGAVLAIGYFVWPTPYRNAELPGALRNRSDAVCCYAARANRFTDEVQVLTVEGWESLSLNKDSATTRAAAALILSP